jgi:hypothetical protein
VNCASSASPRERFGLDARDGDKLSCQVPARSRAVINTITAA